MVGPQKSMNELGLGGRSVVVLVMVIIDAFIFYVKVCGRSMTYHLTDFKCLGWFH